MATFDSGTTKKYSPSAADTATANIYAIQEAATAATIKLVGTGDAVYVEGLSSEYTIRATKTSVILKSDTQTITINLSKSTGPQKLVLIDGEYELVKGSKSITVNGTAVTKVVELDSIDTTDNSAANTYFNNGSGGNQSTGTTFTLTASSNKGSGFTGGSGDDTFDGALNSNGAQTLNAGDELDGGAGTDTLDLTIISTVTPASLTAIEEINATFTTNNTQTLNLNNATGVTSVAVRGSTATGSTVSGIGSTSVALTVQDQAVGTTLAFKSAVVEGESDSATLSVNNVTGGNASDVVIAGIETLNVVSTGSANTMEITAADATTINISGSADLDLDSSTLVATGSTAVTKVNASSFTGALSIATGALANATGIVSITSGSGNDSIDFSLVADSVSVVAGAGNDTIIASAVFDNTDYVDGGQGTDTLSIGTAIAVDSADNVTGIEILTITATGQNQDLDAFSASTINRVNTTVTGNGSAVTFTDASSSVTTLGISAAAPDDVTFTRKADTSADVLTIAFTGAGTTFDAADGVLSVANEETLTISSGGTGANTIDTLTATDLVSLTVTGAQNLTITEQLAATGVTTINSSAATGSFSLNAGNSANAVTATTGTGNTTLTLGGGNDTITANSGNDVLNAGNGNNSINGGAGNDSLDGGTGNDTLVGGTGNDTLDASSGIDSLSGGDGNDTFEFNTAGDLVTTVGSADSVDGGAGTDTILITTATAFAIAPTLTNIERVSLDTDAGVAFDASGAASLERVTILDGSSANSSLTNLKSGVEVLIFDQDVALTIDTVANASVTVDVQVDTNAGVTITDAASVTLTSTATTNTDDLTAVALDNIDTRTLTIIGSTDADADLDTGAITGSDQVTTISASSSTSGAAVIVDTIVDADSLTTLTVNADYGNVTFGAIGGTGTAENLATVTLSANNGAVATLTTLTADTTNSTTDLTMTLNATASSAASSVVLGDITNTFGAIVATLAGDGEVGDTGGTDTLVADDVTINWSTGTASLLSAVTATDDVVLTNSGSGAHTITTLTSADDVTITHTGSAALTITTIADGVDDITINASTATGAVIIGTNNDTGATSVLSATTGSGNDSLAGAAGNDSLDGGAGNDELEGAAGDDTLSGGDGNDVITAGAGNDNISGGSGNDTIALAGNWTSDDTIDGGDGNDTLTITVAANTSPTLTSVETASVTFNTGGSFNAGNASSVNKVNLIAGTTTAATVINLASGATVTNTTDEAETLTLDTVAAASLTVNLLEAAANALTITDARTVSLNATDTAANASVGSLVLDNTDTTTLNVTGDDSGASTLGTGNVTGVNALTALNITTQGGTGTVTVGTVGAAGAESTTASSLANITISASTASATVGVITADTETDSTTDLAMTVNASANAGFTATVGAIDNEFGTVNYVITGAGTIATGAVTADDASVDATGASGIVTVNFSSVASAAAVSFGSGTNTYTVGLGNDVITLASEDGTDTIKMNTTNIAGDIYTVNNFEAGAGGDVFHFSEGALDALGDLVGGDGGALGAGDVTLEEITAANTTVEAATEAIVLTGSTFATLALAQAAIENNGALEITWGGNLTANDDFLVIWSDGTDTHLSVYVNTTTNAAVNPVGGGTLTDIAVLVGVDASVAGTLADANFAIIA